MFKILGRDMEEIQKTQIKLQEIKTTMYEMKNTLNEINGKLDIRMTADFLSKQCNNFKVLEEKLVNIEFYTQQKHLSKNEGRYFFDIQELKEFIISRPDIIEEVLSQKKMIPDGNMDIHKEMKNTGNYVFI